MIVQKYQEILAKHLPKNALELFITYINEHPINLKITNSRSTKLGDFKAPFRGQPARISVNGDLNPYSFLITLIHEVAHWIIWEKHKSFRSIKPHGKEWKAEYKVLMEPYLMNSVFPEPLLSVYKKHMLNPKASSSSDIHLMKELREFDIRASQAILADLNLGAEFLFRGASFQIMKKNRTRFLCQENRSKRNFLIHAMAEVVPITFQHDV